MVSALLSVLDFLYFWGLVFLVSTTLVAVMKRENRGGRGNRAVREEDTQGVMETYKLLFSIIKLPSVFTFCVLLLTAKVRHCDASLWFTSTTAAGGPTFLCCSRRSAFLQQML